jgi:hypothetical protein
MAIGRKFTQSGHPVGECDLRSKILLRLTNVKIGHSWLSIFSQWKGTNNVVWLWVTLSVACFAVKWLQRLLVLRYCTKCKIGCHFFREPRSRQECCQVATSIKGVMWHWDSNPIHDHVSTVEQKMMIPHFLNFTEAVIFFNKAQRQCILNFNHRNRKPRSLIVLFCKENMFKISMVSVCSIAVNVYIKI